jgi:uncharacterized protein (TIGR03792 family)
MKRLVRSYPFLFLLSLILVILLLAKSSVAQSSEVAIEWLKFQVPILEQSKFIQKDQEIWTNFLAKQPGFIHKDVLSRLEQPEEITMLIYWKRMADWQAIPKKDLEQTQSVFEKALGTFYPTTETRAYRLNNTTQQKP